MEKVVLAYSGGLDTSYCVKYLSEELGLEVYTALANTGGFSTEELKVVEEKAYALGAKKHVNLDVTTDYYEKCIKYMVFGNVLRNHTYPISVSSERTFQALAIVNYANEIGAQYIAHGSTGAGNDQIRFDLCFKNATWYNIRRCDQMVESWNNPVTGCRCYKGMYDYLYGILCQQILERNA